MTIGLTNAYEQLQEFTKVVTQRFNKVVVANDSFSQKHLGLSVWTVVNSEKPYCLKNFEKIKCSSAEDILEEMKKLFVNIKAIIAA